MCGFFGEQTKMYSLEPFVYFVRKTKMTTSFSYLNLLKKETKKKLYHYQITRYSEDNSMSTIVVSRKNSDHHKARAST